MSAIVDLLGQRFGGLRVAEFAEVREVGETKVRRAFWHCVCDCGTNIVVCSGNLRSGNSTSCGCWKIGRVRGDKIIHGDGGKNRVPEYVAWVSMKSRCEHSTHHAFARYGGRGIKVCERWRESYQAFLTDLGRRPSPQHSLDRIDNDGHYEPGNVRWATRKQQANNRRKAA